MYVVHFLENKNILLCQFLNRVPEVGEDIKIKGRKGKVTSVNNIDDKHVHVQLTIEKVVNKSKLTLDPAKKKKR